MRGIFWVMYTSSNDIQMKNQYKDLTDKYRHTTKLAHQIYLSRTNSKTVSLYDRQVHRNHWPFIIL